MDRVPPPKVLFCHLNFYALFCLLFAHDDLAIHSLMCLSMVCFRVDQFDAVQIWHFVCEYMMTPHIEANLWQRPHLAFK